MSNAYIQALALAHEKLRQAFQKLQKNLRAPAKDMPQLRNLLGEIQECLVTHFHLEEENGYMTPVRILHADLEPTIQKLGEEHPRLTRSLDGLIKEADVKPFDDDFGDLVSRWLERVRDHEDRETHILLNALGLENGGGG